MSHFDLNAQFGNHISLLFFMYIATMPFTQGAFTILYQDISKSHEYASALFYRFIYIISTAESLQQCYTNYPVVVVGVICGICIISIIMGRC